MNATLEVNEKKYTLVYTNGDSLYDAMQKLQTNTDFRFGGRDFGRSLGYFVEEINGVKTSEMFPVWPRIITQFIMEATKDDLIKFLNGEGFNNCQAYYKDENLFYKIN